MKKFFTFILKQIVQRYDNLKEINITNRVFSAPCIILFILSFFLIISCSINYITSQKITFILQSFSCFVIFIGYIMKYGDDLASINITLFSREFSVINIIKNKLLRHILIFILTLTAIPLINNHLFAWGTPIGIIITFFLLIALLGYFLVRIIKKDKENNKLSEKLTLFAAIIGLFAILINYLPFLDATKTQLLISTLNNDDKKPIDLLDENYYNYEHVGCIFNEPNIPFQSHLKDLKAHLGNTRIYEQLENLVKDANCAYRRGKVFFKARQYGFAAGEHKTAIQKLSLLNSSELLPAQFKDYLNEDFAVLFGNLGVIYYELKIESRAMSLLKKSIEYKGSKPIFSTTDSNLALLYAKRSQFIEAVNTIKSAIKKAKKANPNPTEWKTDGTRKKALKKIANMQLSGSNKNKFAYWYNYFKSIYFNY